MTSYRAVNSRGIIQRATIAVSAVDPPRESAGFELWVQPYFMGDVATARCHYALLAPRSFRSFASLAPAESACSFLRALAKCSPMVLSDKPSE